MFETDWSVDEVADVSLIELSVHNPTAVDRRVRVESRLDGPVLPPRDSSVPEAGWDERGYAGVVPAGERIALGFAVPAPPTEPPVSVSDEGRATNDEGETSAADAVRALGPADPPADALPAATGIEPTTDEPSPGDATARPDGSTDDRSRPARNDRSSDLDGRSDTSVGVAPTDPADEGDTGGAPEPEPGPEPDEGGIDTEPDPNDGAGEDRHVDDHDLPPAVASWVEAVARRTDDAERLTDATVAEAAAVAADRDGVDAAVLAERVRADEARLRALADRATTLADRAAETDVPVDALARLS